MLRRWMERGAIGLPLEPGPPVTCPVCRCERFEPDGSGVNCVCHSCHSVFPIEWLRRMSRFGFLELARPLTGDPELLEPGDVLELLEDADSRPYLWDLED